MREGFGDRLAEGAWRLAESVHPEGTRLVYAVKRLELPAHSARALKGMSIGYATATRGGSHHDTRPTPQYAQNFDRRSPEGKPEFAMKSQHFTAVDDSLVLCRFTSERGFGLYVEEPYAGMVGAITGWDMTIEELERRGWPARSSTWSGFQRAGGRAPGDDALPWRVMHEPIPDGPSAGAYCPPEELAGMLDRYYALRGWDADGVPTTPAASSALDLYPREVLMPVTRFEVTLRRPLAGFPGYEELKGRLHFAIDPLTRGERRITDVALAPARRERAGSTLELRRVDPRCRSTARSAAGGCCSTS